MTCSTTALLLRDAVFDRMRSKSAARRARTGALPTTPQAPQPPQKRSIDVLPKPDNLTCYLHRGVVDSHDPAPDAVRWWHGVAAPPRIGPMLAGEAGHRPTSWALPE